MQLQDSNFQALASFNSPYFTIQDSLYLKGQADKFSGLPDDIDLKGHSKVYVLYSIEDDIGIVVGEFLFEYTVLEEKEKQERVPLPQRPVQIHGSISMLYEYNSANFPGSGQPAHFLTYVVSPQLEIYGVPLSGNIRFSPLQLDQYRNLSFGNLRLDTRKLEGLKQIARQKALEEAERREAELKAKALAGVEETKTKLKERISQLDTNHQDLVARLDSLRPDTLSNPADTLEYGLPDSLTQTRDSLLRVADSLRNTLSIAKEELQKLEEYKKELELLHHQADSIRAQVRSFDLQNPIKGKLRLKGLGIGRVYPDLPRIIGNQSSISGLDLSFGFRNIDHAFSIGKLNSLDNTGSHAGLIRYSAGFKISEGSKIRATLLHCGSEAWKRSQKKISNQMVALEYEQQLLGKGLLDIVLEGAGSWLSVWDKYSAPSPSGENLENRETLSLVQEYHSSAMNHAWQATLKGNSSGSGTGYSLSFMTNSVNYATILNPYLPNGFQTIAAQVKQNLFGSFAQVGLMFRKATETGVSELNHYQAKLVLKPRRLPKLNVSYSYYERSMRGDFQQENHVLFNQLSYQKKIGGQLHVLDAQYSYQEVALNSTRNSRINSWMVRDEWSLTKTQKLAFSVNQVRFLLGEKETLSNGAQASYQLIWKENTVFTFSGGCLQSSGMMRYTSSAGIGTKWKMLSLFGNYQFNSMQYRAYTTPQLFIHQINAQIHYAF